MEIKLSWDTFDKSLNNYWQELMNLCGGDCKHVNVH